MVQCVQHQPSAVPSKPLGGFSKAPVKQEAPAAAAEPVTYNQMAPPMTAYTAEYALAKASAAMDGNRQQVHTPSSRIGLTMPAGSITPGARPSHGHQLAPYWCFRAHEGSLLGPPHLTAPCCWPAGCVCE